MGKTPRMKAKEVMRIGRKRSRAASSTASCSVRPSRCSVTANSTIRIAFFADSPMIVMSPTLKNTSFGRPRSNAATAVPMSPTGTAISTAAGMLQLS